MRVLSRATKAVSSTTNATAKAVRATSIATRATSLSATASSATSRPSGQVLLFSTALFLAAVLYAFGLARAASDFVGWEKGGKYDSLYDPKESDGFKGRVEDIVEIIPLPGMAPGVGLIIRDKADNKAETVHLGPKGFVDLAVVGLKKGDQVKVMGVWATVGGKEVILAAKVKKDEKQELKLRRTKDGKAFWTMSPEELAQEKEGK